MHTAETHHQIRGGRHALNRFGFSDWKTRAATEMDTTTLGTSRMARIDTSPVTGGPETLCRCQQAFSESSSSDSDENSVTFDHFFKVHYKVATARLTNVLGGMK